MNEQQRKRIEAAQEKLLEAKEEIESVFKELSDAYYSLPAEAINSKEAEELDRVAYALEAGLYSWREMDEALDEAQRR